MKQELIQNFLERFPNHNETVNQFAKFHQDKLWNQLTNKIIEFLYHQDVKSNCPFTFYQQFVSKFQTNIDQIKLLRIITLTIQSISSQQRLDFFINFEKKGFLTEQPKIICRALQGIQYIELDIRKCLKILEGIKKDIEDRKDIDEFVYSTYHRFAYLYYTKKQNYKQFYSNALQYLAYITANQIQQNEKIQLSFQMALSTFVSEQIYNFSQLLQQPLLITLKNSDYQWVYRLLEIFNKGEIKKFQAFKNNLQLLKNQLLQKNRHILDQKISIMAFLELLFNLPKNDRVVTFEKIAASSGITEDDVELMVMKTMALNLVKGGIDQLRRVVIIDWIAPKVLERDRIIIMQAKFDQWSQGIAKVTNLFTESLSKQVS